MACSTSLWVAFPACVQQRKALKTQPRCAQQPGYAYHAYRKYTGIPWDRDTSLWRTKFRVPRVSIIEGFHCTCLLTSFWGSPVAWSNLGRACFITPIHPVFDCSQCNVVCHLWCHLVSGNDSYKYSRESAPKIIIFIEILLCIKWKAICFAFK